MSNTVVNRFAFRTALPTAMLAVLFYTLRTAEREQREWIAQYEMANQKAVPIRDIESIPFLLPFQHSDRVQDMIGLQWPAFAIAGFIAPVPSLFDAEMKPTKSPCAGFVTLAIAVGLYWFMIALWIDKRLIQRRIHSRIVRVIIKTSFALSALSFAVFLGKNLLGGWPEGPQGAYGVTAWLALASALLLAEIKGFRHGPSSTSEL